MNSPKPQTAGVDATRVSDAAPIPKTLIGLQGDISLNQSIYICQRRLRSVRGFEDQCQRLYIAGQAVTVGRFVVC